MRWNSIFLITITLIFIILFIIYGLFSSRITEFSLGTDANFSLNNSLNSQMQFYPNMRFQSSNISYRIENNCTLKKKEDMLKAFGIIENKTILNFYPLKQREQIYVSCNEKSKTKGKTFVAGEGGPINISSGGKFNVIFSGKILLIRSSPCFNPNIATHELLHVLGFKHSKNPNNIMYPMSKCKQTIGKDIVLKIDKLYSFPSEPDLKFEKINATIKGVYMNLNISIINGGLKRAGMSKLIIYTNNKTIKNIEIQSLGIGEILNIRLTNILIPQLKVTKLRASIKNNFSELSKDNNQIALTRKYDN